MLRTLLIVPNKIDSDDPWPKVRINANIKETKLISLWKFDTKDFNKITVALVDQSENQREHRRDKTDSFVEI